MTEYKHRVTLIVPESLISKANQLALIIGEFAADVNTFNGASWQDADGNKYAVCSTLAKPIVLSFHGKQLNPENLPDHAKDADVVMAQDALDSIVLYTGDPAPLSSIVMAVDIDPRSAVDSIGLTLIEENIA